MADYRPSYMGGEEVAKLKFMVKKKNITLYTGMILE